MIKVAVIGLGGAGEQHVQTYKKEKGIDVVLAIDANKTLAKKISKDYGIAKWSENFQDAINDSSIDAISIASPPFLRKEIVIPAAKVKKDILCEKPLAINMADALAMKKACQTAGVKFMVNFGARNLPAFKLIRELLESGEYGSAKWVWAKYMLPAQKHIFMPPAWFWTKETGGGILVENAGHLIDYVNLIMGKSVEVSAVMETLKFTDKCEGLKVQPDIEDIAVVNLKHESGAMTTFSNGCISPGIYGINMDIVTDKCVISLRDTKHVIVQRGWREILKQYRSRTRWNPIPFGVRTFVQHLKGKIDNVAGFDDGIAALNIANKAFESAQKGKVIGL